MIHVFVLDSCTGTRNFGEWLAFSSFCCMLASLINAPLKNIYIIKKIKQKNKQNKQKTKYNNNNNKSMHHLESPGIIP